jgi:hypothetical protein
MRRFVSVLSIVSALGLLAAPLSAQTMAGRAPAPTYDAVFDVQGESYIGGATFSVDKAGKVSGTMKLTSPAAVDAKLNGTVTNGVWKFAYEFTMDNQGQACGGTVSGTAKVTADLGEAAGDVNISGTCSPDALVGTFKFTKKK